MSINSAFTSLADSNKLSKDEYKSTVESLTQKLNSIYYGTNSVTDHLVISGSAGRGTATTFSDVDCCFILPDNVYSRFCSRTGNIQSQLLSEIKEHIQSRYPNSDIRGDGQVVDAGFHKRLIELVPSFRVNQYDDELVYPDSNDDGSWLRTNPFKQKEEIRTICKQYPFYIDLCQIIRCWKNEQNVPIKGVVIDSLVAFFLNQQSAYSNNTKETIDFLGTLTCFFSFLSSQSCPNTVKIIGESDYIETCASKCNPKASRAFKKLSETNMLSLWDNCVDLFGDGFPDNPAESHKNATEQFIQDLFPVKIKNHLRINCDVTQDGFRPQKLLDMLKNEFAFIVPKSRKLNFYIDECDVCFPYDIYWKVRNEGSVAREKDQIRGQIIKGDKTKQEPSVFHGPHYVECYIVKNGICVARSRIDVPII